MDTDKTGHTPPVEPGLISKKLPHIFYGGDYNPEQWPEEVWHEDVRLMREAGVNLVSLGIFSWAKLEPRPGEYEFGWLDKIIDLLYQNGIMVDLATASASPPPWLAKHYPDSLPLTENGTTLWPGSRQAFCPSSPAYRQGAQNLAFQLANRYHNHPALVMWHINNEYGCHVPECYCATSAAAFRQWLQRRYGTLEALNDAWGTAFWSQRYYEWDEINPPRSAPSHKNPTQQLDFKRFSSEALLECFDLERQVLKEITPDVPVTTNFMGFFKPMDYWKWAAHEDFVSNDSYPDPSDPQAHVDAAASYDLMRSLGHGKPWILMEQTSGQVNWRLQNVLKRPGQMRLWSYQALARGANAILFFQWRASKARAEKFHSAMVPHVGTENSRIWRETVQLGNELKELDVLLNTQVKAEVAVLFDWESWWALELDAKPSADVKMLHQLKTYYAPLFEQNIALDFVHPDDDLSGYKVVLVPNLYMAGDELAPKLEDFVAKGGRLVMSFFSGIADENEQIRLGGYPAPFRKVLGLRVEEFDPYRPGHTNRIKTGAGDSYQCDLWSDVIDLEGAQALATYEQDFYAGRAAVTRHRFGQGVSYYLGTRPEPAYMSQLLVDICEEAEVGHLPDVPAGVELVVRCNDQKVFLFVLNHNQHEVEIKLNVTYCEILTGQSYSGKLKLAPYGVAILEPLD